MKKSICITTAILCAIAIIFFSIGQIRAANQKKADEKEGVPLSALNNAPAADIIETHILGETIDMSGRAIAKGAMPDGVTYRFDNPRIISEEDIMSRHEGWIPYYDSAMKKYDDPLYLQIDLTITNMSSQDIRPAWFTLEAGPWSTVVNKNTICLENQVGEKSDITIASGQERTLVASYRLWEPTFLDDQWEHVLDLPYQLAYLDYPEKHVIPLSDALK